MSQKCFSDETMKKVSWVRTMHNDWKEFRNANPNFQNVCCDLENFGSFSKKQLCDDLSQFITEVKKLDGSDFPSHILYNIIICFQF